jgi:hypothetical protein
LELLRESQGEDTDFQITENLRSVHRTLAIAYCQIFMYQHASRYLIIRQPRIETDQQSTEPLTYQQQLHLSKQRKQLEKKEKKAHAKGVIEQDHPVVDLAIAIISAANRDKQQYQIVCDRILDTKREHLIKNIPIIIWQHLISQLLRWKDFETSRLMVGKMLLLTGSNYALGWYLLFILSLLCEDMNSARESYQRYKELLPNSQLITKFWNYVMEQKQQEQNQPQLVSKL